MGARIYVVDPFRPSYASTCTSKEKTTMALPQQYLLFIYLAVEEACYLLDIPKVEVISHN
jgi:hypothetical protein